MSKPFIKLLRNHGFNTMVSNDTSTGWLKHIDKKMTALVHIEYDECLIVINDWKKNYHSPSALEEALDNDFIEDRRKDKIKLILNEI